MVTEDVRGRVSAGATLLDEKLPGWEADIDLDHLDMGIGVFPSFIASDSGCGCVGAQIAKHRFPDKMGIGYWIFTTRALELDNYQAYADNGFIVLEPGDDPEYKLLTEAWREEVLKRLGRKVAA